MNALDLAAQDVLTCLVDDLRTRVGSSFEEAVSVGLLGSFAVGQACAFSDLDCYVGFDLAYLIRCGRAKNTYDLASWLAQAESNTKSRLEHIALAGRLSVCWATEEALAVGVYDEGRWPAYDRRSFLEGREQFIAGKVISPSTIKSPHVETIKIQSAQFLLAVLKRKLDHVNFFPRLKEFSLLDVRTLGPIAITKGVSMPVRLLQTALRSMTEPIAPSTEEAFELSHDRCCTRSWWPLAEAARRWREQAGRGEFPSAEAAVLYRLHATALYLDVLNEYESQVRNLGEIALAQSISSWAETIRCSV